MVTLRPIQEKILSEIRENADKKVIVINAPTGVGKSIVNLITASDIFGSGYVTSPLRVLVSQYSNDIRGKFQGEFSAWSVMGRDSYPCKYLNDRGFDKVTADGAPCTIDGYEFAKNSLEDSDQQQEYGDRRKTPTSTECPVRKKAECGYFNDKDISMSSNISVHTFHYFYLGVFRSFDNSEQKQGWPPRSCLVIDEAHDMVSTLCDFFKVSVSSRTGIKRGDNEYDFPFHELRDNLSKMIEKGASMNEKLEYFTSLISKYVADKTSELQVLLPLLNQKKKDTKEWKALMEHTLRLKRVINKMDTFHRYTTMADEWALSIGDENVELKPFSPKPFMGPLWSSFHHIVLSSATMFQPERMLEDIGLGNASRLIINAPSDFPPDKGPIQFYNPVRLNRDNFDSTLPGILDSVKRIASSHPTEKGIIHAFSRKYQEAIFNNSDPLLKKRFIIHDSKNREEKINEFIESKEPSIFLSVNFGKGVDLHDDLARWQVIVKAPIPSFGDPWIAYHRQKDASFTDVQAIREIMQMSGRIVRSREDYGVTYILDGYARTLLKRYWNSLPEWFRERVVW